MSQVRILSFRPKKQFYPCGGIAFLLWCVNSVLFCVAKAGSHTEGIYETKWSIPCHSDQKSRIILIRLFLSKPQVWYIITLQRVSHQPFGMYIITLQSVFSCGLMIYNAPHWWYTATSFLMIYTFCESDWSFKPFLFWAVKYKSFTLYPFRSIYGVSFNHWFAE